MNDHNYKIYKNIMATDPVIDEIYLNSILNLSETQKICNVVLDEVKESNTSLVIKATVKFGGYDEIDTRKLFIKTVNHNQYENAYHNMSMKEGKFYKLIRDNNINNLLIPRCYDIFISEDTGEFLIVLEDLSEKYVVSDSAKFNDKNVWFSCIDSLAQFHSRLWNNAIIDSLITGREMREIEAESKSQKEQLHKFLLQFNEKFNHKIRKIFNHVMEINISLMKERQQRVYSKNNITICNGDSHIYNFMLPTGESYNPLIVDFQFWGEGIGTADLAHFTRVGFSDELKEKIQIPLVEYYHTALLKNGVTNYSWNSCFRGYHLHAATMVLIPFYQYIGFGIEYNKWINDLQGLLFNYDYLECYNL